MITKNSPKLSKNFICELCDYKCSKESDYKKHLATRKHLNNDNTQNKDDEKSRKKYICECGKEYNHRQGLYTHKTKCDLLSYPCENIIIDASKNEITLLTNLVFEIVKNNTELQKQTNELLQQNQNLQKQMLEVCKNGIVSNSTVNSHNNNKTFNLQFFLNEQCKDAMNIMDFVNTFQLEFSDFERIGEVGYVEGISNIVIDKLNEMDVHKRPIHCSDAKREIMYVKDKDVWEKENANNDKIRLALKHITKKNSDLIRPWANAHPGVLSGDHRLSDKYQIMIIESMGGNKNKTMKEGETKIIKKISKMVLIDKGQ